MAAGLLRARQMGPGSVVVRSAGFGPPGEPATPETVAVMADVGIDLTEHRSERVTAARCRNADLVIGMTRQHVIELVVLAPDAWPRIFPIVDLLRRGRQIGPRLEAESPPAWIRRAHGGRQRSDLLRLPADVDIADPIGQPMAAHRRTRDDLDRLTRELAELLAL
jgi:protein-tyrosine phosphatase